MYIFECAYCNCDFNISAPLELHLSPAFCTLGHSKQVPNILNCHVSSGSSLHLNKLESHGNPLNDIFVVFWHLYTHSMRKYVCARIIGCFEKCLMKLQNNCCRTPWERFRWKASSCIISSSHASYYHRMHHIISYHHRMHHTISSSHASYYHRMHQII